jgi:2-polyprenyl-3-methyl-5-hydroxy-6-metoxy-1,4-benzoquinol methylase
MAYVYMKVLEESPDEYESGITKLTAGKINEVYTKIIAHVKEGHTVLDLGCGPGTLAILCAIKGAEVGLHLLKKKVNGRKFLIKLHLYMATLLS